MSISLPTFIDFTAGRPRLNTPMSVSRYGNRAISFMGNGDSYWTVDIETQPMDEDELARFEAWLARTRAGLETIVYTPLHKGALPRAYWNDPSNPAVADDGNLVSITNGKTISINSLTNGLELQEGDLVSLTTGDYHSLHRVLTGGVAAGNALTLTVQPFIPSYIAAGAVFRCKDPRLNTRIVPSSIQVADGQMPVARFQLMEVPR
ncbi:hypothetical protein [uncultured Agrobacterium sp.]|uniref:hypothetical protein n=1 Tax=uncultured Agrobacterium sp. TaxID=157277 RepID=UPI002589DAE3|nr:hypothetical protein [uncultured Agrobacterium sp.]